MRLATVQVSRVFTTGISRNKEIHLKVLIEDDSKILGHPLLVFYPTDSSATHIKGQWENLVCRIHAGSGKARSAQVLRNSPRAMQLSGYERVRPEMVRCRIDSVMTGDAVRRKCSPVFRLTIDV